MTNAIEQTKREMYGALANLKGRVEIKYSVKDVLRGIDEFEGAMESYLELMRSTVMGNIMNTGLMKQERDELRNKLQAQQMASATSAEIIAGLRKDLFEARSFDTGTMQRVQPQNASSERTDAYTLGFNGSGKCSNPFPINTVERLHWSDGAKDAKNEGKPDYSGLSWRVRTPRS